MNRSILAVLCVGGLTACPEEEPQDCTMEARASVVVTLVDAEGNAIPDGTVTYSSDGLTVEEDCEGPGADGFVCGYEVAGPISILATAPGYEPVSEIVVVEADECHVSTAYLQLTMDPVACTEEIVPSVLVSVTDSAGQSISTADVVWNLADEDDLPEPCTYIAGNEWSCGQEVAGELRIDIDNAGPYEPFSALVTVEEDECHVITENLDAVLQFLPD
jgi:hypothetical protein